MSRQYGDVIKRCLLPSDRPSVALPISYLLGTGNSSVKNVKKIPDTKTGTPMFCIFLGLPHRATLSAALRSSVCPSVASSLSARERKAVKLKVFVHTKVSPLTLQIYS